MLHKSYREQNLFQQKKDAFKIFKKFLFTRRILSTMLKVFTVSYLLDEN